MAIQQKLVLVQLSPPPPPSQEQNSTELTSRIYEVENVQVFLDSGWKISQMSEVKKPDQWWPTYLILLEKGKGRDD